MCVYVYTYIHIYSGHANINMYASKSIHAYRYANVILHVCMYVSMHVNVCMYVCMYVCIHLYIYVYIYIYIMHNIHMRVGRRAVPDVPQFQLSVTLSESAVRCNSQHNSGLLRLCAASAAGRLFLLCAYLTPMDNLSMQPRANVYMFARYEVTQVP